MGEHVSPLLAIRWELEKTGKLIGPYDLQLSAQALALDLTLVTHNTREFERVSGLRIEDWELTPSSKTPPRREPGGVFSLKSE